MDPKKAPALPVRVPGLFASAARQVGRVVRETAPGRALIKGVEAIENEILWQLKQRLDELERQQRLSGSDAGNTENRPPRLIEPSVQDHLQYLRDRALTQTEESAREDLVRSIAFQLVPDEMRILGILSDADPRPVVHLDVSNWVGSQRRQVLTHINRLDQEGGTTLGEGAYYLRHLDQLGLLAFEPEDKGLWQEYDRLENRRELRTAISELEQTSGQRPKIRRETVTLSELGKELWQATGVPLLTDQRDRKK